MSDESPRARRNRQRNPNSFAVSIDTVLVEFTDRMPSPGSPEYAAFQERLKRRQLELTPDAPFIVDESKKKFATDEQPPAK